MEPAQEPPPALLSRIVKAVLLALYRWKGWVQTGSKPAARQCVILGAPHTTNWDFVVFLGFTHELGIRPSFMGKLSLFRWPLTRFMHDMGGVPVDRSRKGDYVAAMIAEFHRRKAQGRELSLVIAPEGTRSGARGWRSGFYHIANGAGVPIVPAWVDHVTMRGGLGPEIMPTGDYAADLAKIAAFYRSVMPHHPQVAAIEQPRSTPGESQ